MDSDKFSKSTYQQQMTVYISDDMHEFIKESDDINNFSEFCRSHLKKKMVEEGDQSDLMQWAVNHL